MSDRMTPIPFASLMEWILDERRRHGAVFGVRRPFFARRGKTLELFGERLETPFGPAAGPHTQLAQNIVAAYVAGARFFELKTVQTLDGEDLPVSKPCILAEDEGYNVEWSTELRVHEAFAEYVKAWFMLKLIAKEFGLGDPDGFVFNMSVGYNFDGITSKKIDDFIEGLKNAEGTPVWDECARWAKANLSRFTAVDEAYIDGISPAVCTSVTLSTLHGCPPQEIERIAGYLLEQKRLHTFVKCNPTLLGYDFCRRTLDGLGFDAVAFDEFHFRDDLQYKDAVPMFRRLQDKAAGFGLSFGLKLSNTFPVKITKSELPGEEMYMSGRALYPLTVEMARRLAAEFDGQLRLSFSGGADAFNIEGLFDAGIWPVTLATTLLKVGGYQRLTQMAESLQERPYRPFSGVSVGKVTLLAENARHDARHTKAVKPQPPRKIDDKVPLFDCFIAPCTYGCPIHQDIPEYIELVGKGAYAEALALIVEKNPLPSVTGRICPHRCTDKCTRGFYEEHVHIRDAKLAAAVNGFTAFLPTVKPGAASGKRVAVIGGGPAGMAAGFFLARQGAAVTLFEQREKLGGVVRYVIPSFRIQDEDIDRDEALLYAMGVDVRCGADAPGVAELKKQGFEAVVFAIGAWARAQSTLKTGEGVDALEFLEKLKAGTLAAPGETVVIVGGGNTAMDAARAAKRLPGVKRALLVYRRTKRYMPAEEEELRLALDEGVEFFELLSPVSLENGTLTCNKIKLGEPDASGRRSPVETGETLALPCDTLVFATGEGVETEPFTKNGVALDARGRVTADPGTLETSVPGVYVIGDAKGGPATVVEAIADARRAADAIAGEYRYEIPEDAKGCVDACYKKQGILRLYDDAKKENRRCLTCSTVCECCATVCPNRANIAIDVPGARMHQIVHVDKMCNECGNCRAFCPYDSAPYLEKLTLFSTEREFAGSKNPGFYPLGGGAYRVRLYGEPFTARPGDASLEPELSRLLTTIERDYAYLLNL